MKKIFEKILDIDNKVLEYFIKNSKPNIIYIFSKFTYLAEGGLYGLIIFALMFMDNLTMYDSYILGFAMLLNAIVINAILKKIFRRARPFIKSNFDIDIKRPKDFSFPSGHTSVSATITVVCIYYILKYNLSVLFIVISIVFLILMGISRLCLKVHYLSDVVVGLIFGIINGSIAVIFRDPIRKICSDIILWLVTFIHRILSF